MMMALISSPSLGVTVAATAARRGTARGGARCGAARVVAMAGLRRFPPASPSPARTSLLSHQLLSPTLRVQPRRGQLQVAASFLGVGAPEAVMVGIVALVVFGPKGLAEAAKSLGQAARSIMPTVRELAEVSQDLKSTIEEEIGLDEIKQEFQGITAPTPRARTTPLPGQGATRAETAAEEPGFEGTEAAGMNGIGDEIAKQIDPDIEAKRAASAQAAWGGQAPVPSSQAAPQAKSVSDMSIDELQAEIARRKVASVPQDLSAEDK